MRKIRLMMWFLIASAIAAMAAQLAFRLMDRPDAPRTAIEVARETITGEFSLIDHRGNIVTDADFRGSWLLVFFGFTHCPDVCPTTLATVGLVMDTLGEDASNVQPLFITIDPARDTPAIMADYVAAFHPRIIGLTGSPEQIAAAARSHYVYYARAAAEDGAEAGETEYAMDHSTRLYLMDRQGVYAHGFSPTESAEEIATGIRRIMNR